MHNTEFVLENQMRNITGDFEIKVYHLIKWYMCEEEFVQENQTHNITLDFEIKFQVIFSK